MDSPFILCGLGRVGWRVLEYLQATGAPIAVVDTHCSCNDPRLAGVKVVVGDCRKQEVLKEAGLERARGVLIVTSDDLVNISTALMVRHVNAQVRIVVRMFNQNLIARLGNAVANTFALSTSALAAPLLALIARTGEALGTFKLKNDSRHQLANLRVTGHSALVGRTIAEATAQHGIQVVVHTAAGGEKRYLNKVDPDARLAVGDRLVVCGESHQLAPLAAEDENVALPELLWAGYLRRMGRVAWRTLREIDVPVKICGAILVFVIVASTLVFHFSMERVNLVDAFYRTISLIATGSDMHGQDFEPGGWQRGFVSMLRLAGTALVAAFTAIITNYLVRAQIGGALEVRRIPEKGHVIVCGLGNVGFRVVQELLHQGERVVAIERKADSPFIPTARRLGVAVIIGDATLTEVLRQAHAAAAKAVVVATSNELVNLEVALLVRELHASKRVVLRLTDPHLARTLREAANIRMALSIPELAAPAFLAAAFGDHVHNVLLVEGKLLAVLDLTVHAQDGVLDGHAVRDVASYFHLVPAALARGEALHKQPLDMTLEPGDRLTVILALTDLQRLLQRAPVATTST
jgi:Trk K+ transport system NAD-binding subunit